MNIPQNLALLITHVTNRISDETLRENFSQRVTEAIGQKDRDFSKVIWLFLGDMLDNLPETAPAMKELLLPIKNSVTLFGCGDNLNHRHIERARDDAQEMTFYPTDYANIAVLVAEEILEPGKGRACSAANLAAFLHGFDPVPTMFGAVRFAGFHGELFDPSKIDWPTVVDGYFTPRVNLEFMRQQESLLNLLRKA